MSIGSVELHYESLVADFMPYASSVMKRLIAEDKLNDLQVFMEDLTELSTAIDAFLLDIPDYLTKYVQLMNKKKALEENLAAQAAAQKELEKELFSQFGYVAPENRDNPEFQQPVDQQADEFDLDTIDPSDLIDIVSAGEDELVGGFSFANIAPDSQDNEPDLNLGSYLPPKTVASPFEDIEIDTDNGYISPNIYDDELGEPSVPFDGNEGINFDDFDLPDASQIISESEEHIRHRPSQNYNEPDPFAAFNRNQPRMPRPNLLLSEEDEDEESDIGVRPSDDNVLYDSPFDFGDSEEETEDYDNVDDYDDYNDSDEQEYENNVPQGFASSEEFDDFIKQIESNIPNYNEVTSDLMQNILEKSSEDEKKPSATTKSAKVSSKDQQNKKKKASEKDSHRTPRGRHHVAGGQQSEVIAEDEEEEMMDRLLNDDYF